jgi:hypothetical protein
VPKNAFIVVATTFLWTQAAHAGLMIPDIANDRIMLFDHVTGHLVDPNWITDAGAIGWGFRTPHEAMVVNNEIWVSDEGIGGTEGAIRRFDLNTRTYNSSITTRTGGAPLREPQGLASDGTNVYVTHFGFTSSECGITRYDTTGVPGAFFNISHRMEDIAVFGSNLLVTNAVTLSIQRLSANNGFLINNFATGSSGPRQVSVLGDNSVLALFPANAGAGVYHYNPDGTVRRYIATSGLSGIRRGAYLLGDGNYLVSTSAGVYKYDIAGATFEQIMGGVDTRLISFVPEPSALALAAATFLLLRQRRNHR